MNKITKDCLDFLNSIYDSQLMREYNESYLSYGYRTGNLGIFDFEDNDQQSFLKNFGRNVKDFKLSDKEKVEEILIKKTNSFASINKEKEETFSTMQSIYDTEIIDFENLIKTQEEKDKSILKLEEKNK